MNVTPEQMESWRREARQAHDRELCQARADTLRAVVDWLCDGHGVDVKWPGQKAYYLRAVMRKGKNLTLTGPLHRTPARISQGKAAAEAWLQDVLKLTRFGAAPDVVLPLLHGQQSCDRQTGRGDEAGGRGDGDAGADRVASGRSPSII